MIESYLVESGQLQTENLEQARKVADPDDSSLGPLLVRLGFISESDLATAFATCHELSLLSNTGSVTPLGDTELPLAFLRQSSICPIGRSDTELTIALVDPEDRFAIQSVEVATGKSTKLIIATRQEIDALIDQLEGLHQSSVTRIVGEISVIEDAEDGREIERLRDMAAEAPIVRLVNLLIARAIDARASDIHVEPFDQRLAVRYRIDGVLKDVESPPISQAAPITSRIKLMSGLDIAERRLPQDGRIRFQHDGRSIDLRISTFPTVHGESVVMRILDSTSVVLDLEDIGFSTYVFDGLQRALSETTGIFLATGPTGSGKTTTLYAALQQLNSPTRKILTVEDPVEYQIDGINQLQVKPQIGLDFARALRSIVRQDPDVILIGEMRDLDTSRIAIQSALTGHLVLSTLHTNDAGSSMTRLLDMGVENYLVTSTVRAILAQRLVRTLCIECREEYKIDPATIPDLALGSEQFVASSTLLYRPTECPACDQSGYRGRSVIAEIMHMSDPIRDLIMAGADGQTLQAAAKAAGMISLGMDGVAKVLAGVTSLEEVARVTTLAKDASES